MDYTTNIRTVVNYFYVDTGGLDVGSVNLVQGIKWGKNWEITLPWNSKGICKAILSVVEQSIEDALQEDLDLTFSETGNHQITVSFNMGW